MDQLEAEHQSAFEKVAQNDDEGRQNHTFNQQPTFFNKYNNLLYLGILILFVLVITIFVFNLKFNLQNHSQYLSQNTLEILKNSTADIDKKLTENQKKIDQYRNISKPDLQRISIQSNLIYNRGKESHYNFKINLARESMNLQMWKDNEKAKISYLSSLQNIKFIHQNIQIQRLVMQNQEKQWQRIKKIYSFTIPQQSFCVIVPTKNSYEKFRYEYILQSIFVQKYTNYRIVVINDQNSKEALNMFQHYALRFPKTQSIKYVDKGDDSSTLSYIYTAATQYCSANDIAIILQQSGELLGPHVFKIFNSMYTTKNLSLVYSNSLINNLVNNDIKLGYSASYNPQQKLNNQYRYQQTRMGPLRSFKIKTFLEIPVEDLKDQNGKFFDDGYQQVLYSQLLQLSCGKNEYLDEFNYRIEVEAGKKQFQDAQAKSNIVNHVLRTKKRHQCPI